MSSELENKPIHGKVLPGETPFHIYCGNEFMVLGPGRTIKSLLESLRIKFEDGEISVLPTIGQLSTWSNKYDWVTRCADYDMAIIEYQATQAAIVFQHKLSKTWGRTEVLIRMAEVLESELMSKLWVNKVSKNAAPGTPSLNVPLIQQLRSVLNDIALETGGRRRHGQMGEASKESEEMEELLNLSSMSSEEIENLSELINKALADEV